MTHHPIRISAFATFLSLSIAGCAVSPADVENAKNARTAAAESALAEAKSKLRQEQRMTSVDSNYLGDVSIELPYAAQLPESFFALITLRANGYGTVTQAAKNINLATGIPVRVNQDVEGISQAQGGGQGQGPAAAQTNKQVVRLSHSGTLHAYVKDVANSAGIEWEYKDGGIHFFRLITRSFALTNISPGDVSIADVMAKGGQSQTGQKGGENAATNGSFNSSSSIGTQASYSTWKMLEASMKSALSTQGKLTLNEGTGTVTVTDTKDAVNRIEKIVNDENTTLGKQILVDVRVIRIDVNKESQAGVDLNAVLAAFSSTGTLAKTLSTVAPGTQTTAAAGTLTFVTKKPIYLGNNSQVAADAGSTLAAQALNQFGTIVSDSTSSVITTNRVPAMTGSFRTTGFLAATTPAAGGAAGGGAGVPGLSPGSVTTGSFMRVLPTIRNNNTVLLSLSVDISELLGMGSASTGSGATLQQIQWANTNGQKTISNIVLAQEESMVMVGIGSDSASTKSTNSISGASAGATTNKTMFVVVVTPRILKSF